MSDAHVLLGDNREYLRAWGADGDGIFDSVVTDPPYELGFMNKGWDKAGITFDPEFWKLVLAVLKPGGYLLAFGGTRTYHRMTVAIEDAGFEIRDSLHWMYGSGFPKSLNGPWGGTALKPAHEPIVLARRPLVGTVAANVARHGTGGINVDGCRVGLAEGEQIHVPQSDPTKRGGVVGTDLGITRAGVDKFQAAQRASIEKANTMGRWPPNVLLSHTPECVEEVEPDAEGKGRSAWCAEDCPVAELDRQSGASTSRKGKPRASKAPGDGWGMTSTGTEYEDSGGASRFFPTFRYVAKAARSEREAGCEDLPARTGAETVEREPGSAGLQNPRAGAGRTASQVRNHHPTVKPVALMRWLCRLVTPENGVVLDPFCGSGSTGLAAVQEGFNFIGLEREPEYVPIAEARLHHAARLKGGQR